MKKITLLYLIVLLLAATGCQKYNKLSSLNSPAYLRVFNDIVTTPTIYNNGNLNNYLTFLMDPVMDKSGSPLSAGTEGDFLATRQLYTISYPENAANTVAATGVTNYEYPGRYLVRTAPPINGFDCSSWAQITSGKHRIVFMVRPNNQTPFDSLSAVDRGRVLIDTTFDFSAGELYTIAAVQTNLGKNTYGAYVRQEEFIHNSYSADSLYVAIYNLSADLNGATVNTYSPYYTWFTDSLKFTGAAYLYDYTYKAFDQVPGPTPADSLTSHFNSRPAHLVFPRPPKSNIFDPKGNLGLYGQFLVDDPRYYNTDPSVFGTLPNITIDIKGVINGTDFPLYCWASPVNYNLLYTGNAGFQVLPNLNLVSGQGNQLGVYPTFNILEVMNDRVFLSQIQQGFNTAPQ